jgi:hypothetical protein
MAGLLERGVQKGLDDRIVTVLHMIGFGFQERDIGWFGV